MISFIAVSKHLPALAACFTADAVLLDATGRDEIRERMAERRQARADAGELPRHVTANVLIEEETATSARVTSYFVLVVTEAGSAPSIPVTGRYDDEFALEDGSWLIKRRHIHLDVF